MQRKQTVWGKEKAVKAARWFWKPQGAFLSPFLFSNEQETIYFNHRTIRSGFRCLWNQHAKHLNLLCRMLLLVSCKSLYDLFWILELYKWFNKVGVGQDGFEDFSKWPVARTPPTVVQQSRVSRGFFWGLCLVFSTMNFQHRDGLVQIKITGTMNHLAACPDLQEATGRVNGGWEWMKEKSVFGLEKRMATHPDII